MHQQLLVEYHLHTWHWRVYEEGIKKVFFFFNQPEMYSFVKECDIVSSCNRLDSWFNGRLFLFEPLMLDSGR